jgi:hypothetical protein
LKNVHRVLFIIYCKVLLNNMFTKQHLRNNKHTCYVTQGVLITTCKAYYSFQKTFIYFNDIHTKNIYNTGKSLTYAYDSNVNLSVLFYFIYYINPVSKYSIENVVYYNSYTLTVQNRCTLNTSHSIIIICAYNKN